ncbi:hypothetical protein LCGC14_2964870, partial [marine sediment metagenome]
SINKDPRQHAYILTAKLITEPIKAPPKRITGFRQQLRDEINEWLEI